MSTAKEIQAKWDAAIPVIEEAVKEASDIIKEEIDREVIWDVICTSCPGWTHVVLEDRKGVKWKEIANWLIDNFGFPRNKIKPLNEICKRMITYQENPTGVYYIHTTFDKMYLLFEGEKDAIMTILRWK